MNDEINKLQDEELEKIVGGVSAHWYGVTYTCDVEAVTRDYFVKFASTLYRDGPTVCPYYLYDGAHSNSNCSSCTHYHVSKD